MVGRSFCAGRCFCWSVYLFAALTMVDGQKLPYPCRRWEGTCEESQSVSEFTERSMNGGRCFCDKQCETYGDCCNIPSSPTESDHVQCTPVPLYQSRYVGAYVRGVCSNGSPCAVDAEDVFSLLPVFNRNGSGYQNLFCALCNGENLRDLEQGNVTMNCKEGFRLNESVTNPLALFSDSTSSIYNFCELKLELPAHTRCIPSVDSCPPGTNASFANQCKSYMRTIFDDQTLYKNIFCAACNGVNLTSLTGTDCTSPFLKGPQQLAVQEFSNFTSKAAFSSDWKIGYSMTILLDMNLQDGNVVGRQRKCQEGMVFDPWNSVCRKVVCPQGLAYQSGSCRVGRDVDGPWEPIWHNSSDFFNDSLASHVSGAPQCGRIEFSWSEYAIVDNMIYLNSSGKWYNMSQVYFNGTAVVVCKDDEYQEFIDSYSEPEKILSFICLTLSLCCLFIHFIIYFLAGKFRVVPDLNMLSISFAIFVAQIFFLLAPLARYLDATLCTVNGILLHYFWLSSFTWSSVIAYDITKTILSLERPGSMKSVSYTGYLRYSLYAWFSPCIPVVVGILLDAVVPDDEFSPVYGKIMCWVGRRKSLLILFGAPVASVYLGNLIFYVITANALWRSYKNRQILKTASAKMKADDARFSLYLKLAMIMGVAWITGLFSSLLGPLRYVSIVMNGLQGVYIFIAFSCKKSMYTAAEERRYGLRNVVERLSSLGSRKSGSSTTTSISSSEKNYVIKSVSGGSGGIVSGNTHLSL